MKAVTTSTRGTESAPQRAGKRTAIATAVSDVRIAPTISDFTVRAHEVMPGHLFARVWLYAIPIASILQRQSSPHK
jgi:hypothetical protein